MDQLFIDRPPRLQPELPFDVIEIPNPPNDNVDGVTQLLQLAVPLVAIVGMILVTSVGSAGSSPWLIIPMSLSVVASVVFSVYSFRRERQRLEEAKRAYAQRLTEMNTEMHNAHDMQRRFYTYNYPDALAAYQIVRDARREVEATERSLRGDARLWERRVSDEDFGAVQLGIGTLPSTVVYRFTQQENFDDPLVREAMKLAEASGFVADIPVIISLRQTHKDDTELADSDEGPTTDQEQAPRTPFTHALSIAGEQHAVYPFIHAFITHFTVFHAPDDAKLYVLGANGQAWYWTADLPHCQEDQQGKHTCFTADQKQKPEEDFFDDVDASEILTFLEGIRKQLSTRKIRLKDREGNQATGDDPTKPFLLLIVDLMETTYTPDSALSDLEADAAISILLDEGAQLGAAVVFLVPERSKAPSRCTAVIEVERTTPASNSRIQHLQQLHFRYTEVGVNTFRYVGAADAVDGPERMDALARRLIELNVRQGFGANVPSSVPFMDLMGFTSLAHIGEEALKNWQRSIEPRYANWLRAKIGLMSGNKARTLIFSAKHDGVHGMVAGSTGSGKSELLISLISSMAVTYASSVLNFVLVDYKGGGAFKGLDKLPHVVDIITNLQRDGVTRMFTAIQSELQRRQALNVRTNTKNIVDYRQQGLHLSGEPYPFLFIIIDEFAEMIADRPEYKLQLESITRVGRAQGVTLILAAQRPSGVTDQMRSNIKFRICLRVETTSESREMLRREDAAYLPGGIPGRGYLQVGNDEIELIQVAYTGEKYVDPDQMQIPVIWPGRHSYHEEADQEPPELYKAIVDLLDRVASANNFATQRAPWPSPLPPELSLGERLIATDPGQRAITSREYLLGVDEILLGQPLTGELTLNPAVNQWINGERGWAEHLDWEQYAMRPVVGLIDDPVAAKQRPLVINLPIGHVAIFGASGWGKTTFIRTLAVSLAATHSPDHLHMYVLDLGGRNLSSLQHLPHVGCVIIPDEEGYEERVEQLVRQLEEFVDQRKVLLANAGIQDIYQYNQVHPNEPLPAILVAIDNFVEFKETFGGRDDDVDTALDKLVTLTRQAKPYGIHFVLTIGRMNDLPNALFSLFTERLTLKLAEAPDYRAILGAYAEDFAGLPGRGYIKHGQVALAFQVAEAFAIPHGEAIDPTFEARQVEQFAQEMLAYMARVREQHQFKAPVRIDALPKSILFKQILARRHRVDLNPAFLARLKEVTARTWQESLDPESADWLKVTLGVISGDRLREMHFEAKKDGVHGLIAGGTGSGKSELLMTLIVGLALDYDPSVLNFVLVDYKGGGAFQPFGELPHVVDIVTNLNKSAVRRMFTSINAEMQRRQKLNADTQTKDIVEYRQKNFHRTLAPYPHLFIIIDEYAEMISDSPEFKAELDSITRVGRAQGVNLLLAAQRPTGVTDQMRANIKYRICLRVEELDTSREMLRRSDAAHLPNGMPGRGYLQVGNDNIELIQMAYTGETYPYAEVPEGGRPPKFYDVVVNLTQDLLTGPAPDAPWPPFLPNRLTLARPLSQRYQNPDYVHAMTLGHYGQPTCLNPFIQDWLDDKPAWHGVDWQRTALRGIVGLVDDPYNACQLPLIMDLTKGHTVIFGASGWGKSTLLRTLVASLAATHSPDEFHAHVLDLGGRSLEALSAFPHVGTLIMPDERGYEERVQQLLRELDDLVDDRKRKFSEAGVSSLYEYNSVAAKIEPAILVVVDNFAELIETFGGHEEDETNPLEAMVALIRQGKAFGVHFVITATRMNVLSAKLLSVFSERLTLRLTDVDEYRAILGGRVGEIDEIAGRGYVKVGREPLAFQVAIASGRFNEQGALVDHHGRPSSEIQQLRHLGQRMTTLGSAAWSGKGPLKINAMPKSSSYRQLLGEVLNVPLDEHFLDGLQAAIARNWAQTAGAEAADWLATVLGIALGNRPRRLHFSAKTDGVHGLIAGGTGSGKSELLMTMIVGLAVNYAPSILNFVLVDYKGGGAFKPFERLPHCVDLITNLNKAAVNRMFTAINAEMRRRQQLNAETGTKDIIEYRSKGLHLSGEPYPHLFVIIDEYAEMIESNPEYRAELESITRVGRAQGVNLVLASQRPIGVSDQMRANIKLRLCLRVEQTDTSHEMLRRPDAALLPNGIPGRGYLQVGNENLELIQVSYAGEAQVDDRPSPVEWPGRAQRNQAARDEETPRFFDTVVQFALACAGGEMAPKPWPNFLPDHFSLQSPIVDAQHNRRFILNNAVSDWLNGEDEALWPGVDWRADGARPALRPVAGLVDNPAEARQYPLEFMLNRYHLAVHGDSGMGKTSLLRTLLVSMTTTHSPDELHVYVLDLGGRSYRSLESLPHVGAVIYADDETFEERMQRLLEKLEMMVGERQKLLGEAGFGSLYEYNQRQQADALPAIVVVIDNIAALVESHEILVEMTLMPLVRSALNVGISFVVSCNIPTNMPSKLYALFGERVTLKQGNFDRYIDIVGRGAVEIDDIPGRGYIRVGGAPLMFHAALPVGGFDAGDQRDRIAEADELQRIARHMVERAQQRDFVRRHYPDPIHVLPEFVALEDVLNEADGVPSRRIQAVLGRTITLQPARFDLKRLGPHFAIAGPPLSGKTTTLYNWAFSLASRYPPTRVRMVLVDLQRRFVDYGGERRLDELPHVLAAIHEVEDLSKLVQQLKTECAVLVNEKPEHEIFVLIDDFDDFGEEIETDRDLDRELGGLARRHGRDGLHFIIAGMLEGSLMDIRRQVQSANYGIGLRSGQALDTLRVLKRPAGVQDKELTTGRGFTVKAGQATLLQIAAPYAALPPDELIDDEEQARNTASALDEWVARICDQFPGERATWSAPPVATREEDPQPSNGARSSPALDRTFEVLKRIVFKRKGENHEEVATWDENAVLLHLVKQALEEESGLEPSFFGSTEQEILEAAAGYFPEISHNGEHNEEGAA